MSAERLDVSRIREIVTAALQDTSHAFMANLCVDDQSLTALGQLATRRDTLDVLLEMWRKGEWSPNSGRLIQRFVRHHWKAQFGTRPTDTALNTLAKLAFFMMHTPNLNPNPNSVPTSAALQHIRRTLLDKAIAAGLLIQSDDTVEFASPLLRSYFAAVFLQDKYFVPYIPKPKRAPDADAERWKEVFVALFGIGNPDHVLTAIAPIDPLLAVECAKTDPDHHSDSYRSVVKNLLHGINFESVEYLFRHHTQMHMAFEVLSTRATPYILPTTKDEHLPACLSAVWALGLTQDRAALPTLRDMLHYDPDYRVQAEAAEALGRMRGDDVVLMLRERLIPMLTEYAVELDRKPRILIVNDDRDSMMLIRIMLDRNYPSEIFTADNGEEAIEQFRKHHPDAILMNRSMPVMDGYTATAIITGEDPGARIVIVSASAQLRPSLMYGSTDLLSCPFVPAELTETARAICRPQFDPRNNVIKRGIARGLVLSGSPYALPLLRRMVGDPLLTNGVRDEIQQSIRALEKDHTSPV